MRIDSIIRLKCHPFRNIVSGKIMIGFGVRPKLVILTDAEWKLRAILRSTKNKTPILMTESDGSVTYLF